MTDYLSPLFIAASSVFIVTAIVQLFYYLYYYLSLYTYIPADRSSTREPVSVIICARNEADNLLEFLPYVLEQDYPDYEVIVVNDCSEDHTFEVLGKFLMQYPHLKVSTISKDPKFTHFKKFAQFIGIKAAKNEILLFTDADCQPESYNWIDKMSSHFGSKTNFVLGYGGYMSEKGLLNKYLRYDSMSIAMQYLGMAIRGIPYMGVGRNLAYRRSIFFAKKGFGPHNHLVSGDDDLFVNTNASGSDTCVEFSGDAHTRSVPVKNLSEWIKQKKRHLTTAPYYKFRDKVILAAEPFSRMLFYASFILLCCLKTFLPVTLSVFGIRILILITVYFLASKKLKEPGITVFSLFFDIFSPVINGVIFLSNKWKKPGGEQWK
jgi:poly-beta-1,6-N-acetyl-D-glucosamine synthase